MKKKQTPFPFFKYGFLTIVSALLIAALLLMVLPKRHNSFRIFQQPSSEEPLQLYSNQADDDLLNLYINAIDSAKKSISLVIYKLSNVKLVQALKKKSAEGVSITIVSDADNSKKLAKYFIDFPVKIVGRVGERLMHLKILVIDNKRVLLGSANLTTDSLQSNGNLVIGFENYPLASALTNKINSMDESHGSIPIPPQETMIGGQKVELWMLPENQQAIGRIKSLLRSAKKSIRIAMYVLTRRDIANELIHAYKRGINVEVVIDPNTEQGDNEKTEKMLCDAHFPFNINTGPGLLHYKLAIIDNEILINGSSNWTVGGLSRNDDCFMIVHSLTKEQLEKLNMMWSIIQRDSKPACY